MIRDLVMGASSSIPLATANPSFVGSMTYSKNGGSFDAGDVYALTGGLSSVPAIGDMVLIFLSIGAGTNIDVNMSAKTPAGFTMIAELFGYNSTSGTYTTNTAVYAKVLTTAETSFTIIGGSGSTQNAMAAYITCFRNFYYDGDLTNSFEKYLGSSYRNSAPSTGSNALTTPWTTTNPYSTVIAYASTADTGTFGAYTQTGLNGFGSNTGTDTYSVVSGGGYENRISVGAPYNSQTFTTSHTASSPCNQSITIALKGQ